MYGCLGSHPLQKERQNRIKSRITVERTQKTGERCGQAHVGFGRSSIWRFRPSTQEGRRVTLVVVNWISTETNLNGLIHGQA